jgi:excisionase family DNA binding protein
MFLQPPPGGARPSLENAKMKITPAEPILFTVEEFARHLGCSPGTVHKMIANKTLKTTGDGEQLRIPAGANRRIAKNYLDLIEGVQEGLADAQNAGLIKVVGLGDEGDVVYERTNND